MPNLCRAIAEQDVETQYSVSQVVGQLRLEDIANEIRSSCLEEGRSNTEVDEVRLPPLPREASKRRDVLGDNGMSSQLASRRLVHG